MKITKIYWRLRAEVGVTLHSWHVECYPWCWGPVSKSPTAAVIGWIRHCVWPINRIVRAWQRLRHRQRIIWVDCSWCNGCGIDLGDDCSHCHGTGQRMAVSRGRVRRSALPKGL